MAIHIIKMPDIGEGIAEVEVVQWHVQPGDSVLEDQVLADVMTDKATIEVPSPVNGKVVSLGGKVGEVLAVGAELIRLDFDEEAESANTHVSTPTGTTSGPTIAIDTAASVDTNPTPNPDSETPADIASLLAAKPSVDEQLDTADELEAHAHPDSTAKPVARPDHERAIAAPAVRRRAWELGIDLQAVHGSGTAGRITSQDLDAFHVKMPDAGTRPTGYSNAYRLRSDQQEVPVMGLRRKIAQKMQESKRHIPHFSYVEEIDVTELETLRGNLNRRWSNERVKLSLLPFLVRAMVLAVREFPQVNARFDDEAQVMTHYGPVHMGVATQTEAGLMVPVVQHAESLDLWLCAMKIAELAQAARTGKATRDELSGSTITLSSLGPLGGIAATPVINYPEVAIVGVNRIVERPVILSGVVVARKMMNLSSSFDHRVVDGMVAAQFIQSVRHYLECPALLFIE